MNFIQTSKIILVVLATAGCGSSRARSNLSAAMSGGLMSGGSSATIFIADSETNLISQVIGIPDIALIGTNDVASVPADTRLQLEAVGKIDNRQRWAIIPKDPIKPTFGGMVPIDPGHNGPEFDQTGPASFGFGASAVFKLADVADLQALTGKLKIDASITIEYKVVNLGIEHLVNPNFQLFCWDGGLDDMGRPTELMDHTNGDLENLDVPASSEWATTRLSFLGDSFDPKECKSDLVILFRWESFLQAFRFHKMEFSILNVL